MKIKKGGVTREVSESDFKRKFKRLGYEIVEEKKELTDMSKQELYELAQEYDIEGRTKMSKKELIEAIEGVE